MVVCVKDYVKKNNATCRIEAAIYILAYKLKYTLVHFRIFLLSLQNNIDL